MPQVQTRDKIGPLCKHVHTSGRGKRPKGDLAPKTWNSPIVLSTGATTLATNAPLQAISN